MSDTAAVKPPRTAPRDVRRRQLIEATIRAIGQHGISGTTMSTVAGFAGLSPGLVNFHFKSKDALLEETLKFLAGEHREMWLKSVRDTDLPPAAKLLAIVEAQFHPRICNRKKLAVWFAFFGETSYRQSYRAITTGIDRERVGVIIDLCRRIVADGGYDTIAPQDVANTLEGLFDGFWLNILMYPARFTRLDALAQIHTYLATVFPTHFDHPAPDQTEGQPHPAAARTDWRDQGHHRRRLRRRGALFGR